MIETRTTEAVVTGAAGFIGQHLVRRLADENYRVTAVDLHEPDDGFPPSVQFERLDIRDTQALKPLLPPDGEVFHLASVHLEVGEDEAAFQQVNVRAAEDLVEACSRRGVRRLIHTSSVGIYGHVEDPPADEQSAKDPQTPYERSKLAGERAVRGRADTLGVDVIVLRPAWVYGPGCPRTEKLVDALSNGQFFYIGSGDNLRHPLYIDDMLDAYLLAARASPSLAGTPYLIGGPEYMPLSEMIDTFAAVLDVSSPKLRIPKPMGYALGLLTELAFALIGRRPPMSRRTLAFFENDNAFLTAAAERDLGFKPEVRLEEGLCRTLGRRKALAAHTA